MESAVVLLSGGWESLWCLIVARAKHRSINCVFFNYGQPYATMEEKAIKEICNYFKVCLEVIPVNTIPIIGKVFLNRNESFIRLLQEKGVSKIYLGARSPMPCFDKYKDSNYFFCREMEQKYKVTINTPCLMMPKIVIKTLVRHFYKGFVYSSENFEY